MRANTVPFEKYSIRNQGRLQFIKTLKVGCNLMTAANRAFHDLEQWLASPVTQTSPLHLVEQQQDLKGREVQRRLLQSHVDLRGSGDIGSAIRVAQDELLVYASPFAAADAQNRIWRDRHRPHGLQL